MNEEVIVATGDCFENLKKALFPNELKESENRWIKCIEQKSDQPRTWKWVGMLIKVHAEQVEYLVGI